MGHQFPSEFYTKTNWKNEPDTSTPLGQANLNHIEQGIKTADERIYNLDGRIGVYEDYETEISAQVQQAKDYSESAEDSATDSANSASASSQSASASALSASSASASATQSQNYSRDSEAWAVGTRNGTSVPSTDETYENNSKYYAEQAQHIVDDSTITFTQASTRTNINSGEAISTIMGKIKKFFADLKTVAFTGNASDVTYTNTTSGLSATNVQDAIDETNNVKITLVTFYDLSKYGIEVSGAQINATLAEICKKVPSFCEVKIYWTGNDATRFGTLANQIPETYGSLYIHKNGVYNPCAIEFIPYNSGSRYLRNYDYINSTDHLSAWSYISVAQTLTPGNVPLNTTFATNGTVRNTQETIAKTEGVSTSSQAYSSGQYLMNGGNLKKVTKAIAKGESITSNNTFNTTVGEELTQINSNLSDTFHLWYPTNFVKNGSQSTLTGIVSHNIGIALTKIDVTWTNPTSLTGTNLLILTFTDNFPAYPTHLFAAVGNTTTFAYYNSVDHGLYVILPNGQYSANNNITISGFLGLYS